MDWKVARVLVACGALACAGAFMGNADAGSPPVDEPKKPAAAPKNSLTLKPSRTEKLSDKSDSHEPAAPKTIDPPPSNDHGTSGHAKSATNATELGADASLTRLREGNERWVKEKESNPNTEGSRRSSTAQNGQQPFATILTCADSRLPVERVFDCGVGDVFVIRVAGNVVGEDASGTIEYGAEHLHVPLLVVMGHTKCGAVAAAASGGDPGGNISQLVGKITPAVARAKQLHPELNEKELVAEAVKENVLQSIFDLLRTSSVVREMVHENKVQLVGAVYDIETGKVEWIGEHPWQDALVEAFQARQATLKQTETAKASEHDDGH